MSMQDPISDMLTRIRNGQMAKHESVELPSSTVKLQLLKVMADEGFIKSYKLNEGVKPTISIELKYFNNVPVISTLKRISRPGLRVYKGAKDLPKVLNGLGVAIVSTSQGMLTDRVARKLNLGGEVICTVA
jgi:small subunit ribosomal protein S8